MEILINFIITIIIMTIAVLVLAYLEKRILRLFTYKHIPNKTGCSELLNCIAKSLKLLIQEDCTPDTAKKVLHFAAPIVFFCPVAAAYRLIPFNNSNELLNMEFSAILLASLISISVLSIFLAGYSSGKSNLLIGAIRTFAQAAGYGVPMLISMLAAAFMAGSLNINGIIEGQSGINGLFSWYFIPQIAGCIIFFVCTLALLNRAPLNCSKTENELTAASISECSGIKYGFFAYTKYALLFLISIFFICLYFGGYLTPFGTYILPDFLIPFEQVFWLLLKTFLAIIIIFLAGVSLPKVNHERFLEFSYKVLLPLSLINLNVAILIRYIEGIQ